MANYPLDEFEERDRVATPVEIEIEIGWRFKGPIEFLLKRRPFFRLEEGVTITVNSIDYDAMCITYWEGELPPAEYWEGMTSGECQEWDRRLLTKHLRPAGLQSGEAQRDANGCIVGLEGVK